MSKGIIYIMTTVVDGLIKIGKTGTSNFESRMYTLEHNGYCNVVGLKREFAIEVDDYDDKEALLHNIFEKSQVPGTELFALDVNLAIQLLSSFEGRVVYPKTETKDDIFDEASEKIAAKETEKQKKRSPFRFSMIGLTPGDFVYLISDNSVIATVCDDDRHVSYNGEIVSLSTLADRFIPSKTGVAGTEHFSLEPNSKDSLAAIRRRQECSQEESIEARPRAARFKFSLIGIEPGEVLTMVERPDIVVVVEDDFHIRYKNDLWTMTALAKRTLGPLATNGPTHFAYKGETVYDMRKRIVSDYANC